MSSYSHIGRRKVAGAALAAAAALTAISVAAPALARSDAPAASTPKCAASSLGVWVAADQGDGAAGTIFFPMEFTNLSHHTCTLRGFPRVSAIDSQGHQLGAPAVRDHGVKVRTVKLAPGATAHTVLAYGDVVVSNCAPADKRPAFQLQVIPPGRTRATHAYWDLDTCAAPGSVFLRIEAIQPRAGAR